jgi:adenylyltransferase/sulfurtransferase
MNNLKARYSRHFSLPGFTEECQQHLSCAKVLVAGCGGLGHPVLQYLVSSGIGHIGIADDDIVHISNLHRQILFSESDKGRNKTDVAISVLQKMNNEVKLEKFDIRIGAENAIQIISGFDVVVDCSDNFPTRYLLDDVCSRLGKPLVHGSVYQYEGRVTLLHGKRGTSWRQIFPQPPAPGEIPDCLTGGVLGPVTGLIGSVMATEVIKWITGIGECLDGKMLILDTRTMSFHTMKFPEATEMLGKNSAGHQTASDIHFKNTNMIKEIDSATFKSLSTSGEHFTLIDVREPYEFEEKNLGGILIPLRELPERYQEIPKDHQVIIHCKSGVRSAHAIAYLQEQHGYDNLYNLRGGILSCI